MEITETKGGYVRITAPNGIMDTRNGWTGSEAEVKKAEAVYFVAL